VVNKLLLGMRVQPEGVDDATQGAHACPSLTGFEPVKVTPVDPTALGQLPNGQPGL
jgi:hypothetical protein